MVGPSKGCARYAWEASRLHPSALLWEDGRRGSTCSWILESAMHDIAVHLEGSDIQRSLIKGVAGSPDPGAPHPNNGQSCHRLGTRMKPIRTLRRCLPRRNRTNRQQRTAAARRGCNRRASWPPSLSLGRSAKLVRNTLGMISNLLINTPLQRGVGSVENGQTVLTDWPRRGKPLKRFSFSTPLITPLKRGVNESCPDRNAEFPETPA